MEAPASETALELAGLDWNVVQREVYTDDNIHVPGYKVNVRDSDDTPLGIVTDKYKIVQNREAFKFTDDLLGEGVRYETAGALQDVITTGTGKLCNFEGMTLAGKSGTTTKNRDALFAGYSPYYTCVVWGGFDDNTPQAGGTTSYPKLIWRAVMQRLHEGLENKDFDKTSGIVEYKVCKKSGLLAKAGLCDCDLRGSQVTTEYFATGTEPTEYCDTHVAVTICGASGKPAGPYCPEEGLKTTAYISGGSSGTEDAPYLLPANLSTDTCPVHSTNDIEPVDITGETGTRDEPEIEEEVEEEVEVEEETDDEDYEDAQVDVQVDEEDEPSDSHTGLEDEEQVFIDLDEISE